jgi:hypothetical protein
MLETTPTESLAKCKALPQQYHQQTTRVLTSICWSPRDETLHSCHHGTEVMNTSIQSHYQQQPTEVKLNLGVSGNEQASQPVTYHMNQCELS